MERKLTDTITVAENIKKYRTDKEWSHEELSRKSSITQMSVRNVESGKMPPSLATLSRIAEALDIPTAALFENNQQ